jgi:hypothetical protein
LSDARLKPAVEASQWRTWTFFLPIKNSSVVPCFVEK